MMDLNGLQLKEGGSNFVASGGSVVETTQFRYHIFTSSNTLNVTQGSSIVTAVIVGGGGGGHPGSPQGVAEVAEVSAYLLLN